MNGTAGFKPFSTAPKLANAEHCLSSKSERRVLMKIFAQSPAAGWQLDSETARVQFDNSINYWVKWRANQPIDWLTESLANPTTDAPRLTYQRETNNLTNMMQFTNLQRVIAVVLPCSCFIILIFSEFGSKELPKLSLNSRF